MQDGIAIIYGAVPWISIQAEIKRLNTESFKNDTPRAMNIIGL
jgi:hypothetical protein